MKNLYLLAAFAALATVAVCQSRVEVDKLHKECREQSNVTEEEIKQFFQSGMRASDVKDNMKCHTKCLLEKEGVFRNGVYDSDAALKKLMSMPAMKNYETEVTNAVNNCKNERGANECDTAFKIAMCFKEFKSQL